MTQPYDIPGKKVHNRDEWTWVNLGVNGGYWKRNGTRDKGYNCTAFLMAWLFPDARPAVWGDDSRYVGTNEIEAELQRREFAAGAAELCIPPASGSCVVLYFPMDNGVRVTQPYHVEVYDSKYGDWVGKGSPGNPIWRRQSPLDYPYDPTERAKTDHVFYCKADYEPNPVVSDADVHGDAINVTRLPPLTHPLPPPYSPTWFQQLWRLLVGILIGLLAAWFVL